MNKIYILSLLAFIVILTGCSIQKEVDDFGKLVEGRDL